MKENAMTADELIDALRRFGLVSIPHQAPEAQA
jgi:hypothetical protein